MNGIMIMSLANPNAASTSAASEVDVELLTFVERYATNLLRWDLLLLFGSKPDASMTPVEIAQLVRRGVANTTKELDDLNYLHVLTRRYTPQKVTYQLSRRGNIRRATTRLAAYAVPEKTSKQKS
jgi:hypothetical protein